jgi:hypothetical protein
MTTATISRPTLDALTAWRIAQIAKAEHRSLANATFVLVDEAWRARTSKMSQPRGESK